MCSRIILSNSHSQWTTAQLQFENFCFAPNCPSVQIFGIRDFLDFFPKSFMLKFNLRLFFSLELRFESGRPFFRLYTEGVRPGVSWGGMPSFSTCMVYLQLEYSNFQYHTKNCKKCQLGDWLKKFNPWTIYFFQTFELHKFKFFLSFWWALKFITLWKTWFRENIDGWEKSLLPKKIFYLYTHY